MHGNRGLTLPAAHHDVRSALPYLGATRTAQATKQLASVHGEQHSGSVGPRLAAILLRYFI